MYPFHPASQPGRASTSSLRKVNLLRVNPRPPHQSVASSSSPSSSCSGNMNKPISKVPVPPLCLPRTVFCEMQLLRPRQEGIRHSGLVRIKLAIRFLCKIAAIDRSRTYKSTQCSAIYCPGRRPATATLAAWLVIITIIIIWVSDRSRSPRTIIRRGTSSVIARQLINPILWEFDQQCRLN